MVREFTNGPGDLGSIPVQVIPKTQKLYLMYPCIIRYGSRIKWSNPRNGETPSSTSWFSSYRKESLRVTLDNGCKIICIKMDLALNNQLR